MYQQVRKYFEFVSQMKSSAKTQSGGGAAFDGALEWYFGSQFRTTSKAYGRGNGIWSPKGRTAFFKFRMLALYESSLIYHDYFQKEHNMTMTYAQFLKYRIDVLILYYVRGKRDEYLLMH